MHNFKELKVWQKSIELTTDIYQAMNAMPAEEKFGLISQIRRCAVSIHSNIAEGSGRNSNKEFKNFLSVSLGSAFELETQLIVSGKLNLLEEKIIENLIQKVSEVQKMIYSLQKTLS